MSPTVSSPLEHELTQVPTLIIITKSWMLDIGWRLEQPSVEADETQSPIKVERYFPLFSFFFTFRRYFYQRIINRWHLVTWSIKWRRGFIYIYISTMLVKKRYNELEAHHWRYKETTTTAPGRRQFAGVCYENKKRKSFFTNLFNRNCRANTHSVNYI